MGNPTDNSRDITIPTMLAPLTVPQIIVVSTAFVTVIYSPIRAPQDALRTCYFTVCCRLYSPFPLVRFSGKK